MSPEGGSPTTTIWPQLTAVQDSKFPSSAEMTRYQSVNTRRHRRASLLDLQAPACRRGLRPLPRHRFRCRRSTRNGRILAGHSDT